MPAWRMPPPQHLAGARRRRQRRGVHRQHRADRRAQALGQADAHRVERRRVLRGAHPGGRHGVEEPGAVEMQREAVPVAERAHGQDVLQRHDHAAAVVVGLLEAHQARRRPVHVGVRVHVLLHLLEVERPVRRVEHAQLHLAERRRGALLVEDDVRLGVQEHLVAAPRQRAHGRLVAHGAGGEVQRGLLAEQPRGAPPAAPAPWGRRPARRRRPRRSSIAARISGDGRVTVSLRRSTVFMEPPWRDVLVPASVSQADARAEPAGRETPPAAARPGVRRAAVAAARSGGAPAPVRAGGGTSAGRGVRADGQQPVRGQPAGAEPPRAARSRAR